MLERIHLLIIREVERQGSLTAAAGVLHLTQSALSHSIKKLEQQLGTPVWLREGRSLRPTQAGRYLRALAERVLLAMQAAEREGGDIRGKQSAVLVVVRGKATEQPWDDKTIDLRVDDHEKPLDELARLLKVYRAYEHMNNGDLAVEKGQVKKAMEEYGKAQAMYPDNLEMKYWHAIALANNGDISGATKILQEIYKKDKNWKELTERLPEVGLLMLSPQDLQKVLQVK